eukprot:348726-Amphidinium_carterae.1
MPESSPVITHATPLVAANRRALVQSSLLQPRGCKVAQLISEYAFRLWVSCGDLPHLGEKKRTIAPHTDLPMGA